MKKADLKVSLFLALICFIAGFFVLPYQLEVLQITLPEQYEEMMATIPLPMGVLLFITSLQFFVIAFVFSFFGIKLARQTGFTLDILMALFNKGKAVIDKSAMLLSVVSGLIVALVIVGGIGGLLFGYLYWKKGFEYAVFAHMFAHIFLQLLFIPLFY